MKRFRIAISSFAVTTLLAAFAKPAAAGPVPLVLEIDASDVLRGLQHSHIKMPVRPGLIKIAYPKWIPGEHRPNGPISQMINLQISAGNRLLAWKREPYEPFAISLDVPPGVDRLDIRFDYLSPARRFGAGFGKSPNVTPELALVLFNHVLLYPVGTGAASIRIAARVRFPEGWQSDGALTPLRKEGSVVVLPEVDLTTLVDSPLLAGRHLMQVPLPGTTVRLAVAADGTTPAPGPQLIAALTRLIGESRTLLGGGHSDGYVWLAAVSDTLSHDGLEHGRSSDVRIAAGFFDDPRKRYQWSVLSHELFHAWNGKFRRPVGLVTRDPLEPMSGDLLWVYEGLTRYYGDVVLPARSGLASQAAIREYLAFVAAQVERARPGRTWRSLLDTGATAPIFTDAPFDGTAARRGPDYYNEMMLFWLEADMRIRRESGGRRSLDDFCRRFLTKRAGDPDVMPYSRADVVAALEAVAPLDWERFFAERVDRVAPPRPLAGLAAAGWTVVYDNAPNAFAEDVDAGTGIWNLSTSLGLWLAGDGEVRDVVPGSPAFAAALSAGARVMTIDGLPWSAETLRKRLIAGRTARTPLRLTVRQGPIERDVDMHYHDGLQNPHLIPIAGATDHLARIFSPVLRKGSL